MAGAGTSDAEAGGEPPLDPAAVLHSRTFAVLLVFVAVVGVVVSLLSWGFLELVLQTQVAVFTDLPHRLGFHTAPAWWPLPVLGVAGVLTALAILHLPGSGGHVPADGLQVGGTEPITVPGVALAAFASLALGLVLGPEAPLIAIGSGLGTYAVRRARSDAQPQVVMIIAAAGSFAAVSVVFGSPIVAAVVVIEAAGVGGETLPFLLIPGWIASGVGSLVFIGMANWTGLTTSDYSLVPLDLTHLGHVTWEEIAFAIAIGVAAALLTYPLRKLGLRTARIVMKRPLLVIPVVGLVVAGLAILFGESTTHSANNVLFSGQEQLPGLIQGAGTWSVGALIFLVACKGAAWGLSLGAFRGGPTFPALFLGAAGGIALSHIGGLPMSVAIAVGMGAMTVAVLRLPLSAVILASAITTRAGPGLVPLIIVGVVVAYLSTLALEARLGTATTEADHTSSTPVEES
jgi:H+/Cl- antiporter ClcA